MIAVDIAADANPLGAFIAAAAVLTTAGIAIYENWDKIKELLLWFDSRSKVEHEQRARGAPSLRARGFLK